MQQVKGAQRSGANSAVQTSSEPLDTSPPRGVHRFSTRSHLFCSSRAYAIGLSAELLDRFRHCLSTLPYALQLACCRTPVCSNGTLQLSRQTNVGTRDFPPEEYRQKAWLHGEFEAVSRLYGFEQFECPVLESEALFVRKAGEEITQQLYNFEARLSPERSL